MYPGAAVFAPLRRHPCSHKEWSNRRRQSAPLSLQREEVLVRLQRSERDKAARRVVAAAVVAAAEPKAKARGGRRGKKGNDGDG